MTKAQEIRNRRLLFKAQKDSGIYNKIKEIRKTLAIAERSFPNSDLHRAIFQQLIEAKAQLKMMKSNRFIVTD